MMQQNNSLVKGKTISQYLPTLTGLIELVTQYNKDTVDYDSKLLSRILK